MPELNQTTNTPNAGAVDTQDLSARLSDLKEKQSQFGEESDAWAVFQYKIDKINEQLTNTQ